MLKMTKQNKLSQSAALVASGISIKSLFCLYSTSDPHGITVMLIKRKPELQLFFQSDFNAAELIDVLKLLIQVYNLPNDLVHYRSEILSTTHCNEFLDSIQNYLLGVKTKARNQAKLLEDFKFILWFIDVNVNEIPISNVYYNNFLQLLKILHGNLLNCGFQNEAMISWVDGLISLVKKKSNYINRSNLIWRDMNIYPDSVDIFENVLIPNKINESYLDVSEYLHINFCLLKEDFENNLREGLRQLKSEMRGADSQNNPALNIYNQVRIESLEIDKSPRNGFIHKISYEIGGKEEYNNVSKGFMNGSLLLFSEYSQFSTFVIATVVEAINLPESQKKCSIALKVSVVGDPSSLVIGRRYMMVEPRIFFEPYHQVLKAIQYLKPEDVPMVKYIVYADVNPSWPKYINAHTEYSFDGLKLKLFGKDRWPNNLLKLNSWQIEALQAALTHEFVLIQGPPGSGKTYLIENIIKIMIKNKHFRSSPILLISSKNDSVDRILEPLAISGTKVVRLGGQSKSSVLKKCAIFNVIRRVGGMEQKEKINRMKEAVLRKINANENVEAELQQILSEQRSFIEYCERADAQQLLSAGVEIIGGTTTGCARLKFMLDNLQPEVVIVEDANEVLESHVIASLPKGCKHLILVGDQKQLRPSVTCKSSDDNNLDMSLLERMARSGVKCCFLLEQNRMRPEIASLICPAIYSDLLNSPQLFNCPSVKGMKNNLFFINHEVEEEKINDRDVYQSFCNKHEGNLLLALAGYLLKQGYSASDVTILSPYAAQQNYIKQAAKKYPELKDIEIQVIDSYSGQEKNIIFLSFVRSNSSMIGFLSSNNRINVAISRAKLGLYMIGNMKTLRDGSELMKSIFDDLIKTNAIGNSIELKCQTHQSVNSVTSSEDFKNLRDGGCNLVCKTKLKCGHLCKLKCHPLTEMHQKYICREPCTRMCKRNLHKCLKKCNAVCSPCTVLVEKELPCGHVTNAPCYQSHINVICNSPTRVTFLCFCTLVVPCHEADSCCYSRLY